MEGYKLTYHVDIVFCIDATGSMRHVLDLVKQNALNLYRDIVAEMEKKHKVIDQLRVPGDRFPRLRGRRRRRHAQQRLFCAA